MLTLTLVCHGQIIADHTHTDMGSINANHVTAACNMYRVYYGHTSHGSQIISGMEVMETRYGTPWRFNDDGSGGELSIQEEYGDLGHNGDTAWADMTRSTLNAPDNDRNVVMWSWCGGVSDNTPAGINTYLTTMTQLEQQYPDVDFIYMTGHLDGSGEEGNLHAMNELIRDYCRTNGKILFDFADIESYDPDGDYFLDLYADDECNYSGGNWANEWCTENYLSDLCLDCECAHSAPLNCNLKARAFWWLLAEMVENSGPGHPTPTPTAGPSGIEVVLEMPGHMFRSGDNCYCDVMVKNPGPGALEGHPLFVILVVYDYLFWGPRFTEDYENYLPLYSSFKEGDTTVEVLPGFTWPPVATGAEGIYFIAALTDPGITTIVGTADIWEFGWLNY